MRFFSAGIPRQIGIWVENQSKNRYKDIVPFDPRLVRIEGTHATLKESIPSFFMKFGLLFQTDEMEKIANFKFQKINFIKDVRNSKYYIRGIAQTRLFK